MNEDEKKDIEALLEAADAPLQENEAASTAIPLNDEDAMVEALNSATDAIASEMKTPAGTEEKVRKEPQAKTIEDIVKEEAKEADDKPVSSFSLSKTLGGAIIAKAVQKQIGLVLLITLFLIIYISNRYLCQQQIVKIDKLERQLVEVRYKATVCKSILTEKSRESNIMKMLEAKGDSTLTVPTTPPYKIIIKQ